MADTILSITPVLLIAGIIAIVIVMIVLNSAKIKPITRYRSSPKHERYTPGEFSNQMELDLRLPYRRFRQLYPSNRLTYQEYKDLQMRTAFRRSMSSQDNQRMVR